MAKTPEKVNGAVMRYRRKEPSKPQEDNQTDHREAEPVVEDDAARKKASEPKKKMMKRQLPSHGAQEKTQEVEVEVAEVVESDEGKPKQTHRKHKQAPGKPNGPKNASLLKQLLWKAKPVAADAASAASSSNEQSAADAQVSPAPADSALPKQKKQKPKRSPRPNADDDDEQEEVEYTQSERQNRKLEASKTVVQKQQRAVSPSCGVNVVEMSSQETQPGSDDEAAVSLLNVYENLVPSGAVQPKELAPAPHLDSYFPVPFPLEYTADADLLKQHRITVHEIMIDDFTFNPPQLRVRCGDVVMWKVSNQTLPMVEHSLDVVMALWKPNMKRPYVVRASTPTLRSGSTFAWRFRQSARVYVECSVYKTKGLVLVGFAKAKKEKKETTETGDSIATNPPAPAPETLPKFQKRKDKFANRKRASVDAPTAAAVPQVDTTVDDEDNSRDSINSEVVFHPPEDHTRSVEVDAGVCRAVLSQLEEVAVAVQAAKEVIVIGDVECPVLSVSNQDESENPAESFEVHMHPDEKPSVLTDEWSGTDDDDDDNDERENLQSEENEIGDFQQRVIGMLRRSEEAQAHQRHSFQQEQSGFDAGAAYDFFKQRFMQIQEERQIVYSVCPEQTSGHGLDVTEVVSLLSGSA